MTQHELEGYRRQLFNLGDRVEGDMTELSGEALRRAGGEASGSLSNTPLHLADLGTDTFEQEMTLGLLENKGQVLGEIAAALTRLESGSFGRCERCGTEIPRERLQTLPYTRHCVPCANQEQAGLVPPGTTGV